MKIKYTNILYSLLFILIVAFVFPISVPVKFTNSGILVLYISNFVYVIFGVVALVKIIKNVNRICISERLCIFIYFLIGTLYFIVTIVRYLRTLYYYKSFEMFFWTMMPLLLFFLIINGFMDRKKTLIAIFYALSFINILSVIYHLFIAKAFKTEFLNNVNILVFCCIIGLFFNALYSEIKKNSVIIVMNWVYYIFMIFVSGSRAGIVFGLLAIIGLLLYSLNKKKMKIDFFIGIIIAAILLMLSILFNFHYSRDLFLRGTNLSTISASINEFSDKNAEINEINDIIQDISENRNDSQDKVMVLNDVGRLLYWKAAIQEIEKAPLLGTGNITVGDNGQGSGQTAHNFILEYWLIFGGIGLLLWIILLVMILKNMIKKAKSISDTYIIFLFMFLICGYSFLQPTLVSAIGPTLVWLFWGVTYSKIKEAGSKTNR